MATKAGRRIGRFGMLGGLAVACAAAAVPGSGAGQSATEGLRVERHRAPRAPTAPAGDRVITVVRVDPRRYAFRFLSESHEGPRRPLPAWVRDEGLTGGINAGMFLPDGRSVGFLKQGGEVRSDRTPGRFEAVIAFHPVGDGPRVGIGGAGCGRALPWFRRRYRSVLQARRLLIDCDGRARPWPNRRRYSAAAIGADDRGRVVLVHSRTPYRMTVLGRMLESMDLGLRGLVYMEGGPEASLVVNAPGARVREMGSWEDGFNRNDDNRAFWDLPNVIGFAPRGDGE